jgi:hypothetical protein
MVWYANSFLYNYGIFELVGVWVDLWLDWYDIDSGTIRNMQLLVKVASTETGSRYTTHLSVSYDQGAFRHIGSSELLKVLCDLAWNQTKFWIPWVNCFICTLHLSSYSVTSNWTLDSVGKSFVCSRSCDDFAILLNHAHTTFRLAKLL